MTRFVYMLEDFLEGENMRVELVDKMGSDLSVVNAARVSYNKGCR